MSNPCSRPRPPRRWRSHPKWSRQLQCRHRRPSHRRKFPRRDVSCRPRSACESRSSGRRPRLRRSPLLPRQGRRRAWHRRARGVLRIRRRPRPRNRPRRGDNNRLARPVCLVQRLRSSRDLVRRLGQRIPDPHRARHRAGLVHCRRSQFARSSRDNHRGPASTRSGQACHSGPRSVRRQRSGRPVRDRVASSVRRRRRRRRLRLRSRARSRWQKVWR